MLDSRFEAICLLVCRASQTYVHYRMAEKKKLAELMRLKEVLISAHTVFVGYKYL